MIVVDASVVVEVVKGTALGRAAHARLLDEQESLHAPQLLDLEVVQALRHHERAGEMSARQAQAALAALSDLGVHRHLHDLFVPRIWAMRDNLTAYDAAYVALAEALECPLLTSDHRLAQAHGHHARIELLAAT